MFMRVLLALIGFLWVCGLVSVVLANPVPWDPLGEVLGLDPLQYFQIVVAEFCALVVGVALLVRWDVKWQRAAILLGAVLVVSYILGILVWTVGYRAGVFAFYPSDPSFLGLMVLVFPEFVGTAVGTVVIRVAQKTQWIRALVVMTSAMLASLMLGIVFAYLNLALHLSDQNILIHRKTHVVFGR